MTTPSYEDFEPFCEWNKEEGKETLEVHVEGFKREQLKVYISNCGDLRITGECPIDKSKWRRFTKEFKIPKDCNKNEVNAKFTTSGHLYIVIPKNLTSTRKQDQESVKEFKHNEGIDNLSKKRTMSWKVAMKVVIVTMALAVAVYAIWKYYRSSFVNVSNYLDMYKP